MNFCFFGFDTALAFGSRFGRIRFEFQVTTPNGVGLARNFAWPLATMKYESPNQDIQLYGRHDHRARLGHGRLRVEVSSDKLKHGRDGSTSLFLATLCNFVGMARDFTLLFPDLIVVVWSHELFDYGSER